MSIKHMAAVFELGADVRGANRLVLLVLADYAGDTGECWPAKSTIAWKAGLTNVAVVRKSLRWLEAHDYIETETQGAVDNRISADKKPNLYRLKVGGFKTTPGSVAGGSKLPRGGSIPIARGVQNYPQTTMNHYRTAAANGVSDGCAHCDNGWIYLDNDEVQRCECIGAPIQ